MQENEISNDNFTTDKTLYGAYQDLNGRCEIKKADLDNNVLYIEDNLLIYLNNKIKKVIFEYLSIKGLVFIEISLLGLNNYQYELGIGNQEVMIKFEYNKGIMNLGKSLATDLNLKLFQSIKDNGLIPLDANKDDDSIKFLLETIYVAINSGSIKDVFKNKFLEWGKEIGNKPNLILSEEEKEDLINLLKKENLLYYTKISMKEKDIDKSIIGEYHSSLTLFLNCIGALNGIETINTLKGSSSIGKTAVSNMVTGLFNTKKVGDLSPTALKHGEDYDTYDILYLQESLESDFEQKNFRLISSDDGGFVAETTVKDKETGLFEVQKNIIPAKTLVTTSTVINIHDEFSTRSYIIPLDESIKQTERIVKHNFSESLRFLDFIYGNKNFGKKYHRLKKAITLLEKYDVIIPYEEYLREILPSNQLRVRRDSKKLIQLIKCSAFLFQYQRPKTEINGFKILVATIQDLYNVLRIAGPILESTLTGFDTRVFQAMEIIPEVIEETGYVTTKILSKKMDYTDNYASQILKQLRDFDYLLEDIALKEEIGIKGRTIVSVLNPNYKAENLISPIKDLDWLKFKSKEEEVVNKYIKSDSNYKGLTKLFDVIENNHIDISNKQIENIPKNPLDSSNINKEDNKNLKDDLKDSELGQLSIEAFTYGNEDALDELGQLLLKSKEADSNV